MIIAVVFVAAAVVGLKILKKAFVKKYGLRMCDDEPFGIG